MSGANQPYIRCRRVVGKIRCECNLGHGGPCRALIRVRWDEDGSIRADMEGQVIVLDWLARTPDEEHGPDYGLQH